MTGIVGLDTNVAFRWLFRDVQDPGQSDIALRAIGEIDGVIHINGVVLAELVWLAAQKLKIGRAAQATMVHTLLTHPKVVLSDRLAVEQALAAFELGGAGFVDHFIGALNTEAGCKTTLTFDKIAAKGAHFTAIA